MKISFSALLLRLLWRLSGKRFENALMELDPRVVADGVRRRIEKWSVTRRLTVQ